MIRPQLRARSASRADRPRSPAPPGGLGSPLAVPAFAAALASLAALLFCWPFAMTPALALPVATAMIFAAWAALVAALWLMARALARAAPEPDA